MVAAPCRLQGSNLLSFRLSEKGKNYGGTLTPAEEVTNAKNLTFSGRKG